jgi:hypothetical protein
MTKSEHLSRNKWEICVKNGANPKQKIIRIILRTHNQNDAIMRMRGESDSHDLIHLKMHFDCSVISIVHSNMWMDG